MWKAILAGALLALAGVRGWAAVPINSCPYFITAPGNYVIATDLTCPFVNNTGNASIRITASNVSLNLNGHIITGSIQGIGIGVYGADPGNRLDHVGISGPGLIRGFGTGIAVQHADYVQVNGATVVGAAPTADQSIYGIFGSDVNQLTVGNNVVSQTYNGTFLDGSNSSTVTGNQLAGNGWGITIQSGSGNVVSGNTASGNRGGILIAILSMPATNNRVFSNTANGNVEVGIGMGIGAFRNQIFSNTAVGNAGNDLSEIHTCGTNFWGDNVFFTRRSTCEK